MKQAAKSSVTEKKNSESLKYTSQVEAKILNSHDPYAFDLKDVQEITVNGQTGAFIIIYYLY
jgi:hypothetical protein